MMDPPATRAEIAALLDDSGADGASDAVDRIHATGASLDEIGEAFDDLAASVSSPRVAAVRAILRELADAADDNHPDSGPMSMLGEPIERL